MWPAIGRPRTPETARPAGLPSGSCCGNSICRCCSALRATPHIAVCGCAALGRRAARALFRPALRAGFGSGHSGGVFPRRPPRSAHDLLSRAGRALMRCLFPARLLRSPWALPPLCRIAVMAGHWPDIRLVDGRPLAGHAVLSGRTCGRPSADQERRKPPVPQGSPSGSCCGNSICRCCSALRATPHIAVCGCAAVGRRAARALFRPALRAGSGSGHSGGLFCPAPRSSIAARSPVPCRKSSDALSLPRAALRSPWAPSPLCRIAVMAGHWPDIRLVDGRPLAGHAVLSGRTCGRTLAGQECHNEPAPQGLPSGQCCESSIRRCYCAAAAMPDIAVCGRGRFRRLDVREPSGRLPRVRGLSGPAACFSCS